MSSSVSNSTSTSNVIRFSGLSSGLDTESLVKQLMNAEKIPYTKLQQKEQLLEWTQTAYQDQTTYLKGVYSSYLDGTLSTVANMKSATTYTQFSSSLSSTVSGDASAITVTAGSTATAGNHNVVVNQLATGANISTDGILSSSSMANSVTIDGTNNILKLTVGSTSKDVSLATGSTYNLTTSSGKANLLTNIQSAIDTQFGAGKVAASLTSDNKLVLKSSDGSNITADTTASGSTANTTLGIDAAGKTVKCISLSTKLSDIAGASSGVNLVINGTKVLGDSGWDLTATTGANKDATVSDLINAVKNSTAGATLSYDSINNKFTLASNTTGTASALDTTGTTASLLSGFGFGSTVNGTNAQYTVDGATMIGSSNTNTIDGVSYTFKKTTAATGVDVNISKDTSAVVTKIKDFVTKYNEVITKLTAKIGEKYDKDYAPLTDDQKEAMSEDQITKWETKAKTGLLRNDSTIQSMITRMRNALSEPIEVGGTKYTLSSLGIQTVSYLEDPTGSMTGILKVDETKLKDALENNSDAVIKVFTNESSTAYNPTDTSDSAATNKATRYKENGIMSRLGDIFNDAVRTYPGKGSLLEKAGYKNDRTQYDNTLYNQIKETKDKLSDMLDRLNDKETAYYKKFSNLETLMSKMNSQSSSLASQLAKL